MAQARHETGNFTSSVYRVEHNLFGMKTATNRQQLGKPGRESPEGNTYQAYSSDFESMRDYVLWLKARNFPTDINNQEQFLSALVARGYFGYNPSATAVNIYRSGLMKFAA